MRIVDEEGNELPAGEVGEICGRGPILMPGYYKRPDLTREAIGTAGSTPATWGMWMRTAFSTWSTARRT